MPQPLPRSVRHVTIGPVLPDSHASLAALIAGVITAWAYTEVEIGKSLARLLGSEPIAAMEIYQALSSASARRDVLKAAAHAALDGDDRTLFLALLKIAGGVEKERNAIAHGIWGYSSAYPDGVILEDPKEWIRGSAVIDIMSGIAPGNPSMPSVGVPQVPDSKGYKAKDLTALIDRIKKAGWYFDVFWRPEDARFPNEAWRGSLATTPPIREALRHVPSAR